MTRDALRVVMVAGVPTFPDLPRLPDGTPDWERLGGTRPWRVRGGAVIDPKPSVPHPVTGEPIRPV